MNNTQNNYAVDGVNIKRLWITWENHRRSRTLSEALACKYICLESSLPRILRYLVLSYKTSVVIRKKKPKIVFCQNPSQILALWVILLSKVFKYSVVVDRHTNFRFGTEKSVNPVWRTFHAVSRYTIRNADLTIRTNDELALVVNQIGGESFILPDPLPEIARPDLADTLTSPKGGWSFLFVCTFANDEPVQAVLDAFVRLGNGYQLYVTGDYRKYPDYHKYKDISNIVFLGYVAQEVYDHYCWNVDALVVLTTQKMTLNCGSYESVVCGKPQILYGSQAIRSYFNRGCIYLDDFSSSSIVKAVESLTKNYSVLRDEVYALRHEIECEWPKQKNALEIKLKMLEE